jgi:hypothetical protein
MSKKWSQTLAGKFSVSLPEDVIDWCDSEIWKKESPQEFSEEGCPDGSGIWGGAMLPDTIPMLGNGCGDCLCLRFRPDGTVSEVIRWLHESAMWSSYGNSLSEAILFDAALAVAKRDLSVLPLYADWALKQLGIEPDKRAKLEEDLTIASLFEAGLAEAAVRRELCKQCWSSGLLRFCCDKGCGDLAEELGVAWSKFSEWLVDTSRIPANFRDKLAERTGMELETLLYQDWKGATLHALKVTELQTDLSWPYAVLGWAAERLGDFQRAVDYYFIGLKTLETSSDFTETWATSDFGTRKFALNRLRATRDVLTPEALQDSYLRASLEAENEGMAIRDYWLEQGKVAEQRGSHEDAYRCYYRAGWDVYCFDDMETILEGLVRTARSAGWHPLARIAEFHLQAFRQMWGH